MHDRGSIECPTGTKKAVFDYLFAKAVFHVLIFKIPKHFYGSDIFSIISDISLLTFRFHSIRLGA